MTTPTEPGYYWATHKTREPLNESQIVRLDSFGYVYMTYSNLREKADNFRDWIGPLKPTKEPSATGAPIEYPVFLLNADDRYYCSEYNNWWGVLGDRLVPATAPAVTMYEQARDRYKVMAEMATDTERRRVLALIHLRLQNLESSGVGGTVDEDAWKAGYTYACEAFYADVKSVEHPLTSKVIPPITPEQEAAALGEEEKGPYSVGMSCSVHGIAYIYFNDHMIRQNVNGAQSVLTFIDESVADDFAAAMNLAHKANAAKRKEETP
jgi:hypothetical protein